MRYCPLSPCRPLTNVLSVDYLMPDAALCGAGTRPPRGEDARRVFCTIDDGLGLFDLPGIVGRPHVCAAHSDVGVPVWHSHGVVLGTVGGSSRDPGRWGRPTGRPAMSGEGMANQS